MKIFRYTLLFLFLLNIGGVLFEYSMFGLASLVSYLSYIILIAYYVLVKRGSLNKWMLTIGVLYFIISGWQYESELKWFLYNAIKYFIVVVCGYEVVKRTTSREFLVFISLGALTILTHALLMKGGSAEYSRFSGFYVRYCP